MSHGDSGSVLDALAPKVWNEDEDLRRDPVDRSKPVSPEPNRAEDFESGLFNNVDLKEGTGK